MDKVIGVRLNAHERQFLLEMYDLDRADNRVTNGMGMRIRKLIAEVMERRQIEKLLETAGDREEQE